MTLGAEISVPSVFLSRGGVTVNKKFENIKDMKSFLFISFVSYIVLGIIMIIWPAQVESFASYIIGTTILVLSILKILRYFKTEGINLSNFGLVIGIIGVIAGIYILAKPLFISRMLTSVLSVIVVIDGIVKLQRALDLKRAAASGWQLILAFSILTICAGTFIFIKPDFIAGMVFRVLGIVLVVTGVLDLWTVITFSMKIKNLTSKKSDIETTGRVQ